MSAWKKSQETAPQEDGFKQDMERAFTRPNHTGFLTLDFQP